MRYPKVFNCLFDRIRRKEVCFLLIVALPQAGGELPYGWLRIIHI
jgi:hypothetical protein